jgi:hypothetical protein
MSSGRGWPEAVAGGQPPMTPVRWSTTSTTISATTPATAYMAVVLVRRAEGQDPAHSEVANQRRGEKVTQHQRAFRKWDAEHGSDADPEVFRREILPGLQAVSLGAMAKATGLSEGYCSFIRRGLKIPHQRHWEQLRILQ